jgi:uncharacterized protein (TIGR00730 family)
MEAANKGAFAGKSPSIGLNIQLPHEQSAATPTRTSAWAFRHFFARKVMFVKYASAYVVLPGGFGTLDELAEILTLVQTGKTRRIPIVLVGSSFWRGLARLVPGHPGCTRHHIAGRPRVILAGGYARRRGRRNLRVLRGT